MIKKTSRPKIVGPVAQEVPIVLAYKGSTCTSTNGDTCHKYVIVAQEFKSDSRPWGICRSWNFLGHMG